MLVAVVAQITIRQAPKAVLAAMVAVEMDTMAQQAQLLEQQTEAAALVALVKM